MGRNFYPTWVKFTSCATDKTTKNTQYALDTGGCYNPTTFTIEPSQYPKKGTDGQYKISFDLYYARLKEAEVECKYVDYSSFMTATPQNVVLNDSGATGNTPTEKAKSLTAKICAKLKKDHGENVRIYVVEYGTQSGADLAYIGKCAADTRGKVYKAKNTEELKVKLKAIWKDLQDWTEYQEAKIVS